MWSVAFSADGTTLVSAGADGTARLWDTATGKPLALVPVRSVCNGVAWSRRTRLAIATDAGVAVIDVR